MKRGGTLRRRSALRQRGERWLRTLAQRQRFRAVVLRRAGGRCERCGSRWRVQAHHVLPRGRGGSDDPANGRALCASCHGLIHDATAPDWRDWLRATAPAHPARHTAGEA